MRRLGWLILVVISPAFPATRYSVREEPANGPGSPPVVVLRDDAAQAEAAIAPSQGGELSSFRLKLKEEWVELLYRGRDYTPGGFAGKGPLLWPALGAQYPITRPPAVSCGDGTYPVNGQIFTMPCHGFARRFPWRVVSREADIAGARVSVELADSEQTRKMYPFGFHLRANYELAGGHLSITYRVSASPGNSSAMPFSIGNHIAFNIPLVKGANPADVLLETPSSIQLLRNPAGVLSGEQRSRSFANPTRLGDVNAAVAIPLAGYRGEPYARLVDPGGLAIRIGQRVTSTLPEPLVRFNIFGDPGKGYFSPEPWFGIQNSLNLGRGAVTLAPGASWDWTFEIQPETISTPSGKASPGVEKVAGNFGFVEGPVWTRDGDVIFSDIYRSRLMKLTASGQVRIHRDHSNAANGNAMDREGRLYSCERDGRRVVRSDKSGELTVIASQWEGKTLNSPNDVVVRRDGQIYFTDPASKAVLEKQELGFNGVYHVTPGGQLSLITRTMRRPNGVALSPGGHTLYVADSEERRIYAFDLDAQGDASNQRVAIDGIDGSPDGLRVAQNGKLYIACRGVAIYTPAGKLVRMIEFPEQPANCAFGGSDLQTLYVTARSSVYKVRVPDKGSLQY